MKTVPPAFQRTSFGRLTRLPPFQHRISLMFHLCLAHCRVSNCAVPVHPSEAEVPFQLDCCRICIHLYKCSLRPAKPSGILKILTSLMLKKRYDWCLLLIMLACRNVGKFVPSLIHICVAKQGVHLLFPTQPFDTVSLNGAKFV